MMFEGLTWDRIILLKKHGYPSWLSSKNLSLVNKLANVDMEGSSEQC